MITKEDEKRMRAKQLELGLSDHDCDVVIENMKEFFSFPDPMFKFAEFVIDYLGEKTELR